MGDSGSTFLGFTLASLSVMAEWSNHWAVTMAAPLFILGIPIIDMILITILRVKENKVRNFKEWIDYAGKDHISHRFMRLGLGNRGAVFTLLGIQAFFCFIGLLLLPADLIYGIFGLIFFFALTFGIIFFFRRRRQLVLHLNQRKPKKKLKSLTAKSQP